MELGETFHFFLELVMLMATADPIEFMMRELLLLLPFSLAQALFSVVPVHFLHFLHDFSGLLFAFAASANFMNIFATRNKYLDLNTQKTRFVCFNQCSRNYSVTQFGMNETCTIFRITHI